MAGGSDPPYPCALQESAEALLAARSYHPFTETIQASVIPLSVISYAVPSSYEGNTRFPVLSI
jgi:hypothetical protein